jgi:hypothetical protein
MKSKQEFINESQAYEVVNKSSEYWRVLRFNNGAQRMLMHYGRREGSVYCGRILLLYKSLVSGLLYRAALYPRIWVNCQPSLEIPLRLFPSSSYYRITFYLQCCTWNTVYICVYQYFYGLFRMLYRNII